MNTDTTYTDPKNADYVATGETLFWRDNGKTRYSLLYRPSAEALAWDKPRAEKGDKVLAIGSIFGGFSYVVVKVTGRKETRPTSSDRFGIRAQVTMNIGPDSDATDRAKITAWVATARA